MSKAFLKFGVLIIFLVLTGVGCIRFQSGPREADGGVWRSPDKGEHWVQKKVWLTATGVRTIGGVNVVTMVRDPQDRQAIYLGTSENGLFYTYDGGESWFSASQLSSGRVSSVSIDSRDKCTIYAVMGQRVWKSTDCNRTFSSIYFDGRNEVSITAVANDWYNSNVVYAGNAVGDLLKSTDSGANWATIQRFGESVKQIYIDPFDSRIIYVGLLNSLRKTIDSGATFTDLTQNLSSLDGGRGLVAITGDAQTHNWLIIATSYGILRSSDGGASWEALNLTTPPGGVAIHSLAVNPGNNNEIYYATTSTFYRTINGGANWTTKKLPSSRPASFMTVDPQDSNLIYMGTLQARR